MVQPRSSLSSAAAVLLGLALPAGAQQVVPAAVAAERQVGAMGTVLTVEVVLAEGRRTDALQRAEACIREVEATERLLSTWRDDSELARLNRSPVGAPITLSESLKTILDRVDRLVADTDGAFDPAVGALVDAWDLRGAGRRPSPDLLAQAFARSGFDGLALVTRGEVIRRRDVQLDAGAFGKGAGLDRALEAGWSPTSRRVRLDLGGQLAWRRDPAADRPLSFELADPRQRDRTSLRLDLDALAHLVFAHRGSLATSGNSVRYRVLPDGSRIGHLLDPRTGRPAADWGSVTVLAADALTADALATGFHVLGPDAALRLAAARPDCEVVVQEFADHDRDAAGPLRIRATAGLQGALHALDDHFRPSLPTPVPPAGGRLR